MEDRDTKLRNVTQEYQRLTAHNLQLKKNSCLSLLL